MTLKECIQEVIKTPRCFDEIEVYRYKAGRRLIHGDYLQDMEIDAVPEDTEAELYIMDRQEYDDTILANSSIRASEFMTEEDRIAVIVLDN